MSVTLEITDTGHACDLGKYCSAIAMPPFYNSLMPRAIKDGTEGTTNRSISASGIKSVHYTHHGVGTMLDLSSEVTIANGAISTQFKTGTGVLAGSKLRYVHMCHIDRSGACSNVAELGQSDDRDQALASNTTYTIPIFNTAGTPATEADLSGFSPDSDDSILFLYTFSGPPISGYSIPFYYAGQVVFSAWEWAGGAGRLVNREPRLAGLRGRLVG